MTWKFVCDLCFHKVCKRHEIKASRQTSMALDI